MPRGLVSRALDVWADAAATIGGESDVTRIMNRYEQIVGDTFGNAD
jgi:hypothetical protein